MNRWTVERWAASTGIGFAVLLLVGGFLPGSPKKYNASAAEISSYFHDKHKEVLVGAILFGIGYVLFLWFLASFAGLVRGAGQGRLATVMYGAGVAAIVLGAVVDGMNVALTRLTYYADPRTVQALYGVDNFVFGRLLWAATALALATMLAARRSRVLPDWYAWLSLVAAALFVLGALSLKTNGFFSPTGGMVSIAFLAVVVWVALSSVLVMLKIEPAAPAAAPAVP